MSASELGTEMKRRLSLPDFSGDEEDGADEEGGDSSGESDNQEGGIFRTPPGTPGTHAPELADPAVRQRIVDYHERRIIDDLGLEDMETHQALQAIHERDRLRMWHGNSSDEGNTFADWHPSNATLSTQPVASYSHMNSKRALSKTTLWLKTKRKTKENSKEAARMTFLVSKRRKMQTTRSGEAEMRPKMERVGSTVKNLFNASDIDSKYVSRKLWPD